MDRDADKQHNDADTTQAPATYYGTARMQQMSGGTTSDSQPTPPDADGAYGAARIAQLHGVGSNPAPRETQQNDDAAE